MLDEPTEGVWIGVIEEIAERLTELASAHQPRDPVSSSTSSWRSRWPRYAYVMDRGAIALEGPSAAVKRDPQLATLSRAVTAAERIVAGLTDTETKEDDHGRLSSHTRRSCSEVAAEMGLVAHRRRRRLVHQAACGPSIAAYNVVDCDAGQPARR